MSTLFSNANLAFPSWRGRAAAGHQSNSWWRLPDLWLLRAERSRQRAGLRDIADDPHLLADLGLTREEALEQANRPFWR